MNTVLPYFEDVYHTRMIETFANANARMVRMVPTMYQYVYVFSVCHSFSIHTYFLG